ncbi:hypothetical protein IFM89_016517 [Coptis chinensis]|uniref:Uncharacterized protein n=1 Tax=Coptis chinensis TaxID=261450 RepID=A0A835M648_9MAGN|nr:hypothetical protein IFM89_016517 [Coptis chinensis]
MSFAMASSSSPQLVSSYSFSTNNKASPPLKNILSLQNPKFIASSNNTQLSWQRSSRNYPMMNKRGRGSCGVVCSYSSPFTIHTLQWASTISSVVLVFAKGTAAPKSFLVPIFALQAPTSIISWIKGEYGLWTAFLALLFRLFFSLPGELELPFMALLLVIVSPYQVMDLRGGGTQAGAIIALAIAGYLAYQHFSRLGSLRKAFDQGSAIATVAIFIITAVSCLLLI